jgi:hypothetical protein
MSIVAGHAPAAVGAFSIPLLPKTLFWSPNNWKFLKPEWERTVQFIEKQMQDRLTIVAEQEALYHEDHKLNDKQHEEIYHFLLKTSNLKAPIKEELETAAADVQKQIDRYDNEHNKGVVKGLYGKQAQEMEACKKVKILLRILIAPSEAGMKPSKLRAYEEYVGKDGFRDEDKWEKFKTLIANNIKKSNDVKLPL